MTKSTTGVSPIVFVSSVPSTLKKSLNFPVLLSSFFINWYTLWHLVKFSLTSWRVDARVFSSPSQFRRVKSANEVVTWHFKCFHFFCNRGAGPFILIWIPSSGSQLRFWCPGSAFFKLLLSVNLQRNTPLEECSSEATPLKRTRSNGMKAAISGVLKKLRVKAIISLSDWTSVNWTIEPRRRDRKTSYLTRRDSILKGQFTEVPRNRTGSIYQYFNMSPRLSGQIVDLSSFFCSLKADLHGTTL